MKYRKLRIAWSVVWGVVAVCLVVLWARSYSWLDAAQFRTWGPTTGTSWQGVLNLTFYAGAHDLGPSSGIAVPASDVPPRSSPAHRWRFFSSPLNAALSFPHWVACVVFASLTVLPWIRQLRYRFSLRTLLIATTLIAVVLGLIAWLSR